MKVQLISTASILIALALLALPVLVASWMLLRLKKKDTSQPEVLEVRVALLEERVRVLEEMMDVFE